MSDTFPMEHQQMTDWCWNAVAVSVDHYFNPHSTLTQDEFAVKALNVPLAQTNQPFFLSKALEQVEKLEGTTRGSLPFADVQAQLDANLPVCVQIDWEGGGAHFVVITGYQVSPGRAAQVFVSDPLLRDSNVMLWDYEAFVQAYSPAYAHAEGAWAATYMVKP
jgi:hypothetical protein